jgi:hypothetical protein
MAFLAPALPLPRHQANLQTRRPFTTTACAPPPQNITTAAGARAYLSQHRQNAPDAARLAALLDAGTPPAAAVLLLAARLGDEPGAGVALAAGAPPATPDTEGSTPAMRAASRGHVAVLRLLLEAGGAGLLEVVNHWGYDAIIYAGSVRASLPAAYQEMMALFREYGVEDPEERAERRWTQAPKLSKPAQGRGDV